MGVRGVRGVLQIRMVGRGMRERNVKIVMAPWRVMRGVTVGRVRRVGRCRRVIPRPPGGFPAPKSLITALQHTLYIFNSSTRGRINN